MSDLTNKNVYFFEDFQLDASRKLLTHLPNGETIKLTQKAFEILLLLVKNRGKLVKKDKLMESVWKNSFVEESNITQTISVLRKRLGENPKQHRFIVTESGKGYRFVATVKSSLNSNENSPKAAIETQSSLATEVKSIAVLPFKNIDPKNESQLLGIGMADTVITKLSQTKSIIVRQTNSVIRYTNTTSEATEVGQEINVDAVLEGNIQNADNRIRLSVRLYRIKDNTLLWAESFDEWETDIFTLQDSISEKVANSLSLELNPEKRNKLKHRYTDSIEAYHLYNKGRFFWNSRRSEDLQKSISFYKQAIAIDENYALAYSGLAETYVLLHTFSPFQDKHAFPKAKQAAEKALSLDENLAEAHAALALYKEQFEYDWDSAEIEFLRAICINPSYATAHQWYSEFLGFMRRTEESIAEVERAYNLDPLSLSTNTSRAFPYLASRQYDQAIEKLELALKLDKDFPLALYYLGRCYDGKNNYKKSINYYQKAIEASGKSTYFISALIYALSKNGQKNEAKKAFEVIQELAKTQPVSKYVLARSYVALGEKAKALNKLEEAYQERDSLMIVMNIEHIFNEIRYETRFNRLLEKMNL